LDKIRVGVIGTGYMGMNHMRVYSQMQGVELVAFSDIDEQLVTHLSKQHGIKGYVNYIELLEKEDINAVSVAVPTALHRKVIMDVFSYNKHVLVEKPITVNLEEAMSLIKRAEQKKVIFMVGHVERFNPAIVKIKTLLKNHYFGDIISLSAKRVGPYIPRARDTGVIIDLAIHDIDVMRFLTEKPVKDVYAKVGAKITEYDDYASLLIEFEDDILGIIEVNRLTPTKIRTLSVTCTDGFATIDYITQDLSVYGKLLDTSYRDYQELVLKFGNPEIGKPKVEKQEPLKLELEHFIECVRTNKTPLVNGMEGLKSLEVAMSALQSAHSKEDKLE
jgi:UDP-N-acetylglucosamine 3-dehydrogenase